MHGNEFYKDSVSLKAIGVSSPNSCYGRSTNIRNIRLVQLGTTNRSMVVDNSQKIYIAQWKWRSCTASSQVLTTISNTWRVVTDILSQITQMVAWLSFASTAEGGGENTQWVYGGDFSDIWQLTLLNFVS